nr:MAG TPA: hypothetical protein [Caudoviricetes sp.]
MCYTKIVFLQAQAEAQMLVGAPRSTSTDTP